MTDLVVEDDFWCYVHKFSNGAIMVNQEDMSQELIDHLSEQIAEKMQELVKQIEKDLTEYE